MMKNEELLKCLYDLDKVKCRNDQLSFDYIVLKRKYKYYNEKENKIINGDYEDKN